MVCIGQFFWAVILSLTIHEESMDIGALPWWLLEVLSVLLCYIHSQSHLVQGPLILAGNALQCSWKEKKTKQKTLKVNTSGLTSLKRPVELVLKL